MRSGRSCHKHFPSDNDPRFVFLKDWDSDGNGVDNFRCETWLIEEEQIGLDDVGAGKRDALLLAAIGEEPEGNT